MKKSIKIRLSENALIQLNENVALTGLSREAYIRNLISGFKPKIQPVSEFHDVISQLRAIGNNLNQIAILAHRTGYVDAESYKQEVENLRKEILAIRKSVCEPEKQ